MTVSLVGLVVLLIVLAWFFLGGRGGAQEPTVHRAVREDIDYTQLEEAEREVQEAPDEESVRDWGPGVQKPPIA
jgi:hypothetical protein